MIHAQEARRTVTALEVAITALRNLGAEAARDGRPQSARALGVDVEMLQRLRDDLAWESEPAFPCGHCGETIALGPNGLPSAMGCRVCCTDPPCPHCHGSGLVGHPSDA